MKSYIAVSKMLEVASERFKPTWYVKEDELKRIREYCMEIDDIVDELEIEKVKCSVDPIKMTISVKLVTSGITLDDGHHALTHLIQCAMVVRYFVEEGAICLELVFPGIWCR